MLPVILVVVSLIRMVTIFGLDGIFVVVVLCVWTFLNENIRFKEDVAKEVVPSWLTILMDW